MGIEWQAMDAGFELVSYGCFEPYCEYRVP